jgi:hypothetical protein
MAAMSKKQQKLSEDQIDDLVVGHADKDSAWEESVYVKRSDAESFSLPADLAARAAFVARLHHARRLQEWLRKVIQERIELEESAFAEAKREIARMSAK